MSEQRDRDAVAHLTPSGIGFIMIYGIMGGKGIDVYSNLPKEMIPAVLKDVADAKESEAIKGLDRTEDDRTT